MKYLVIVAVLVSGCILTAKKVTSYLDSFWIGKSSQDIKLGWGRPDYVLEKGGEQQVFTYIRPMVPPEITGKGGDAVLMTPANELSKLVCRFNFNIINATVSGLLWDGTTRICFKLAKDAQRKYQEEKRLEQPR